jgi:hypothetical protein
MIMFIGLYLGPSLTVFKEVTFCKHTSRKSCCDSQKRPDVSQTAQQEPLNMRRQESH